MDDLQEKAQRVVRGLYKKTHFSQDLVTLYASRTLMRIAFGVIGVFLPIFFYIEFGYDLQVVIAIYLVIFSTQLLLTPISSKLLGILGTKRMIVLGILFVTLALVSLYLFPKNPVYATLGYILFISIYKALYWVPYHVDFSNALDEHMRGRQLAILRNIAGVILVLVPFIGGLIITSAGFSTVFMFSIIMMVLSLAPLWFMSNTYETYSWNYVETFKHLFDRRNRPLFLAHASNGAQGVAFILFWPIYIFTLLDERFTALGAIASLTIVAVIILRSIVGKLFDTWSEKKILVVGVVMTTTAWVSKIFVQTPIEIFVADSYHNFGITVKGLSFDATTYEQAADNGRYVDEYTALKEMSLAIGRIIMVLIIAVLLSYFDIRVAFVLAATVALFMLVLNKKVRIR